MLAHTAPVAAVALLVVACSPRPTAEEVVERTTPSICEKAKECFGDEKFNQTYPGGVADCTARTKAAVKEKLGDDLDDTSVCSDEEVDACITDLQVSPCEPDGSLPRVPCNC